LALVLYRTLTGCFTNLPENTYDVLLVDEAHRLNKKSGIFKNRGENQIKETIYSTVSCVFFLDEDQRITLDDIGTEQEIKYWANKYNAEIIMLELSSQFRCNGSDGYLAWIDNTLQIRNTANTTLEGIKYDFQIFDSAQSLHEAIENKNDKTCIARTVAGYCWKWISQNNTSLTDINIGAFNKKWNLKNGGNSWIIRTDSLNEIGCIHTCQGLEMDYVGVIIGGDFTVRNGNVLTNVGERSSGDRTISGHKKLLLLNKKETENRIDQIIKNTYKVLMTRGMKGCYLYCVDAETNNYFKSRLKVQYETN
jgi:DUF2075 family protein